MPDKSWDVFIRHASEDKHIVAEPLADMLRRSGVKVWLDAHELKVGDSLSEKIDQGLSDSHFGIVILSPAFFSKHWPRRELAGLRSREESGQKVILPVWHNVDKDNVLKFSPILSDLIASKTSDGLGVVARDLLRVIFAPASPAYKNMSIVRRLLSLLDSNPDRNRVVEFLRANSHVTGFPGEYGEDRRGAATWAVTVGECYFDAVRVGFHGFQADFMYFSDIYNDPYDCAPLSDTRVSPRIVEKLEEMAAARAWLMTEANSDAIQHEVIEHVIEQLRSSSADLPSVLNKWKEYLFPFRPRFFMYCGRRHLIDKDARHRKIWAELKTRFNKGWHGEDESIWGINLRSYDYVVEEYHAL